jgi:membrane associated rhomboid family serine protease
MRLQKVKRRLECKDFVMLMIVTVVSLICVLVFILPLVLQNALKVRHSIFDPVRYITASFVHGDVQHLAFNLVFFAFFTLVLYYISKKAGKERLLFCSIPLMFLLLPLLNYSLLYYGGIFRTIEYGFGLSLTDSGIIGLTIPFLTYYFRSRIEKFRSLLFVISMALLTFSLILSSLSNTFLLTAVSLVSGLGCGFLVFPTVLIFMNRSLRLRATRLEAYIALLALVFYFPSVASLFPAIIVSERGVTDILSHYIGLLFGIIPFSLLAILTRDKNKARKILIENEDK